MWHQKILTTYCCVLVAIIILLNKYVYWLSDWATNQRTKSIEQSPFWKANIFWSSQTFPVLYGTQYSSTCLEDPATCPCAVPGQPNPCCLVYFLKLNINIIHQFTPLSSMWSFDLRFPHPEPCMHISFLHICYVLCPSHSCVESDDNQLQLKSHWGQKANTAVCNPVKRHIMCRMGTYMIICRYLKTSPFWSVEHQNMN
jgi:hypothetical protein